MKRVSGDMAKQQKQEENNILLLSQTSPERTKTSCSKPQMVKQVWHHCTYRNCYKSQGLFLLADAVKIGVSGFFGLQLAGSLHSLCCLDKPHNNLKLIHLLKNIITYLNCFIRTKIIIIHETDQVKSE